MIDLEQLKKLYKEYLETIPLGDDYEYYMPMREFAEWQIEPFLKWLEERLTRV